MHTGKLDLTLDGILIYSSEPHPEKLTGNTFHTFRQFNTSE